MFQGSVGVFFEYEFPSCESKGAKPLEGNQHTPSPRGDLRPCYGDELRDHGRRRCLEGVGPLRCS